MSDNLLITIQPVPVSLGDDLYCLAGLLEAEALGPAVALRDVIAPEWTDKYTVTLVEAGEDMEAVGWASGVLVGEGITHVALVKSTLPAVGTPVRRLLFGDSVLRDTAFMLWYSQPANEYRMIHCQKCAAALVQWFTTKQVEWDAKFSGQGQVSEARN